MLEQHLCRCLVCSGRLKPSREQEEAQCYILLPLDPLRAAQQSTSCLVTHRITEEKYMLLLSFIFDILNISDARKLRESVSLSTPGTEVCTVMELLVQDHTVHKNTLDARSA